MLFSFIVIGNTICKWEANKVVVAVGFVLYSHSRALSNDSTKRDGFKNFKS